MAYLVQLAAIIIPLVGVLTLVTRKHSSQASLFLLIASLGCLIMNSGYFLAMSSQNDYGVLVALKIEYLGDALFYTFFIGFVAMYQNRRIAKPIIIGWAIFEFAVLGVFWSDSLMPRFFGTYTITMHEQIGIYTASIHPQILYLLRYSVLSIVQIIGLVMGSVRLFRTKIKSERDNLARLVGAQFVIVLALSVQLWVNPAFNIVPLSNSLAILSIVLSLVHEELFGITDRGHEWVFAQMDNAYIIVDSEYGFLDANPAAKKLFPELDAYTLRRRVPDGLYDVFVGGDSVIKLGDRYYEKSVTELRDRSSLSGWGLFLEDVTLMQRYQEELKSEIERQTAHIEAVQDSIITGLASVVESRDNSTGGHINRTSAVVRIFAKKLMEHRDELGIDEVFMKNVIKAAPMHDLGKISVDDVVLKKNGRYTDEEYAKMKKHSAEGARLLFQVLSEINDEPFVNTAINVAHYHHERYDGRGYPNGLSGTDIPLEARIMALADVFDALVSKRCYKEAFSFDKAFSIIEEGLGTQFDPVLGALFMECRPELEKMYTSNQMPKSSFDGFDELSGGFSAK